MSFSFSPSIIKDGLVLYLDAANTRSYVSGSTIWTDISRVGNNGLLINGPTFSRDGGGSVVFDGNDDYTLLPGSILNSTYTIDSCIYLRGNRFTILNNFNDDSNTKNNQIGTDGSRNLYFQLSLNNNTYFYTTTTLTLNINQWYIVSFTRNGTTAKIYVNGAEIPITVVGSSALDLQTYTSNYTIGVNRSLNYTNGFISSLRIYNRALTPSEVLQNFNSTKSRFNL